MELKIYNQQGVFKTAVSPSDSDRHVKEVMNDNILNLWHSCKYPWLIFVV